MQQDNTWQDKGPGKETSKPRHDKKTRQEKKFFFSKKVVRPKNRKAATLQRVDGFIFYMSTYTFLHFLHVYYIHVYMCENYKKNKQKM
jgi:hypothetical protein